MIVVFVSRITLIFRFSRAHPDKQRSFFQQLIGCSELLNSIKRVSRLYGWWDFLLIAIRIGVIFLEDGKKIMAWSKNTLKFVKIRMRAATICTESEKPEKSMKIDRKRYEKCNSNDTHQIYWHMAVSEWEWFTSYSWGFGQNGLYSNL
jgi:hypothetical protein